ncbi:MAG TPA: hypothetical protein VL331_00890 [Croceibacterium sp.]|nr:hypothetical protein [Croceibacterium sp.]
MIQARLARRSSRPSKPFDMPAIHIFNVGGGQIHEIESVGWTAPCKIPNVFVGK